MRSTTEEGPLRGASTIPMQTAKNLFLWDGRSFIRKGLEIPLAYWMDFVWSKRRMIEVYLNIVEWAPGVYGAEAASQLHFKKPAAKLTRREAALSGRRPAQSDQAQCRQAVEGGWRGSPSASSGGWRHRALCDLPWRLSPV